MNIAFRLLHACFSTAPLAVGVAALACGVTLAGRYGGEALAWGPEVGEVTWYPSDVRPVASPGAPIAVPATRLAGQGMSAMATGGPCLFEATEARLAGGSLVVIAREPGGEMLHVRWAGGPTHGTTDCGSGTDLRMHRNVFIMLRNVAGFGTPRVPEPVAGY